MQTPIRLAAVSAYRPPHVPPPLALYVHIPWCVRKCPYCDFNSHAQADDAAEARALRGRYLAALRDDLEAALPTIWGRPVRSVFIGGGTPSLLDGDEVDRLLSDIRARLPLAAECEITLEANPGTGEAGRFRQFRQAGVNRLSIGIQSFNDDHLQRLGRIHDARQARFAAEAAAREFERFNLDLMWALPGQSVEQALADVNTALQFAPPHLSLYQLSIEPNTVFAKFPPQLPDEEAACDMQERLHETVQTAGLPRYEVSAYARAGQTCAHNVNYWTFGDYLGIGAGAHSKLTTPDGIVRQERSSNPHSYLERGATRSFISRHEVVPAEQLPFEFMLNALRLVDGVATSLFAERTGLPIACIGATLQRAVERQLMVEEPTRLAATELGLRFLNDLQQMFLPTSGKPVAALTGAVAGPRSVRAH